MFAEGESDLRDLVVQNLESSGFLNKIKAELRAGVFLALSEEGSLKKKVPLFNKKLDDFLNTSDGKLTLSVIREFLVYFDLNFTLSVFDPEISNSSPHDNRRILCEKLNLKESEFEGPILSALLKKQEIKFSDLDLSSKKSKDQEKIVEYLINKTPSIDNINEKGTLKSFQENTQQKKNFLMEKCETLPNEANKKNESLVDAPSLSLNNTDSNRNFFDFGNSDDIFKDQSVDHFFDDPVPLEKTNFPNLSSTNTLNEHNTISSKVPKSVKGHKDQVKDSCLPPEKASLSSLKDLPSLTMPDNIKEPLSITLGSYAIIDALKESNEELSDKQINSEESIEEDIEEEFSAGLDDLLNDSLSLGDDATSDQTVSQASVIDGVDHIEPCNTVN